jgi:hypothetical protein
MPEITGWRWADARPSEAMANSTEADNV